MSVSKGRYSYGQSTTHDRYSVQAPLDRYFLPFFLSDPIFDSASPFSRDLVLGEFPAYLGPLMRLQSTLVGFEGPFTAHRCLGRGVLQDGSKALRLQ